MQKPAIIIELETQKEYLIEEKNGLEFEIANIIENSNTIIVRFFPIYMFAILIVVEFVLRFSVYIFLFLLLLIIPLNYFLLNRKDHDFDEKKAKIVLITSDISIIQSKIQVLDEKLNFEQKKFRNQIHEYEMELKLQEEEKRKEIQRLEEVRRNKINEILLSLKSFLEKQMLAVGVDLNILKEDILSSYELSFNILELEEAMFRISWSSKLKKRPGTSILYLTTNLRKLSSELKLNDFVEDLDDTFEEWESRSSLEKKKLE